MPIEGLTAKDFAITEDGEPQDIASSSFSGWSRRPLPPFARTSHERFALDKSVDKPLQTQISPPPPGDIRYRDRRLVVLYFDLTAMPPSIRCAPSPRR